MDRYFSNATGEVVDIIGRKGDLVTLSSCGFIFTVTSAELEQNWTKI